MVKKQPLLISDDLRACPHFPSVPDSERDRAQAKALSEPWAVKEGEREGLVLSRSRKKPEGALWGEAKAPASATCPLWFELLVLNC